MGCAPSIHVSQSTGVVYCREDKLKTLKHSRTTSLSISEVVSHIPQNQSDTLITENRALKIDKERESSFSARAVPWIEAETQTLDQTVHQSAGMEVKASKRELLFGPMKVIQQPMEVLLVFGKEDQQTDAFVSACNQGGYRSKIAHTSESAMEYYLRRQPEVTIVDLRSNVFFEGETLCRNIRATRPNENTIIVGLLKSPTSETKELSVLPLLRAGFNRRLFENNDPKACLNELLMLDFGEIASQSKIRASACLFSALENVYDAIEIRSIESDKSEFQYVNPAYERVTGNWRSELTSTVPKNSSLPAHEALKSEFHEGLPKQLSKGKSWEGMSVARRKNGDYFVQNLKIIPIIGSNGKVTHHVSIKRDMSAVHRDVQSLQMQQELSRMQQSMSAVDRGVRDQYEILQNGGNMTYNRRQSMTTTRIEAPITKVINMLNAVQENSPVNVVQVLEKVIDILRSTELFNPFTDKVEDKGGVENDLVDGLMHTRRRHSGDANIKGHVIHRDSGHGPSLSLHSLHAPPEIQSALEGEHKWQFDIIRLERVTNKRPLYYLGYAIFSRFNACKFLSISDDVLRKWLQLIESNYHSTNAYHTSTHAADVLHATSCFLLKENVKNALEPLDEITALIAATVHDVDHPGYTNSFLCNAGSDLAVLYNDIAVLENHHAAMAFKLTSKDSKSNILKNIESEDFKVLRQQIIDMIMATEMKQHFEHLSKFDNSLNNRNLMHDDAGSMSGKGTPESNVSHGNPCSNESRTLIKRMIIKCADIANPARPIKLCIEWATRIAEEYFCQTEEEKRRGLPIIMPVFDRQTCNVPQSQVSFIDYFVIDLYTAWDKFAFVPEAIEYINSNYNYWKAESEKIEKSREQKRRASRDGGATEDRSMEDDNL
ncbi:high affinity cAMP-specific and IBMX-insensitive 3',5'-cyclic phosphodiesterase 8B-like [Rhopilema esculentum]|uniref:high affinity cAMP-specific and IBMX-insensitive 3',5'-cyclic phosphodiesterase 8B-like n=1 Tax=Rhopilema esculentum TaxID=499914 RepID=UPI0031D80866